jgi:protein-tyrosine-phosphatase
MHSVLFVCTANLCRSPMAEAILNNIVNGTNEEKPTPSEWLIESAGTWAEPGLVPPREVLNTMQKHGLDISQHRSQIISADLVQRFKLIIVMEPSQKEALMIEFPEISKRIYLLCELAGFKVKIAVKDPIGKGLEEYNQTADLIENWIRKALPSIRELAAEN